MISVITIRQQVFLPRSPHEVYETLLDAELHSDLTGLPCKIDRSPGGDFEIGENMITGTFFELVTDHRIVQTWKISSYGWPVEHMSRLHLELRPATGGAILSLEQTEVPIECERFVEAGWYQYYWKSLGAVGESA